MTGAPQGSTPPQGTPPPPRVMTANELMIMAMEQFGIDEPEHCMVIFTTPRGNVAYFTTHPILTINIGLLRVMEEKLIQIATGGMVQGR